MSPTKIAADLSHRLLDTFMMRSRALYEGKKGESDPVNLML